MPTFIGLPPPPPGYGPNTPPYDQEVAMSNAVFNSSFDPSDSRSPEHAKWLTDARTRYDGWLTTLDPSDSRSPRYQEHLDNSRARYNTSIIGQAGQTAGETNKPTGQAFTNYDFNTGQGNVDQAYLDSPEGKAYLNAHPDEAFMYYLANRSGGLNNLSDSNRAWQKGQSGQVMANLKLRNLLNSAGASGYTGMGSGDSPLDVLRREGLGNVYNPNQMGSMLQGLSRVANSGAQLDASHGGGSLAQYLGTQGQNQTDVWNMMLYAMNPESPMTNWLARMRGGVSDPRPYESVAGGKFIDFLRSRYGS